MVGTAVDLFCGVGGLTCGLLRAGVSVSAGYDIDEACRFPYEHNNPGAIFHRQSVTELTGGDLASNYPKGHTRILVGCAPCQTFSKYTQGLKNEDDPKWTLLRDFGRLIRESKPEILSIENVPELQRHKVFTEFLSVLTEEGFHFAHDPQKWVICCQAYGVPQHRRRLVIIASRLGPIELIPPTHETSKYFNPFQGLDIRVPNRFRDAFDRYCQTHSEDGGKSSVLHSPFPRMVDMWFLAACLGVREGVIAQCDAKDTYKMIDASILSSDPWPLCCWQSATQNLWMLFGNHEMSWRSLRASQLPGWTGLSRC